MTFGISLIGDEDTSRGIATGLRQRNPGLDVVRVQEVGLMNTPDPDILDWAAKERRCIYTRDVNTMTAFALERVALGLPMLGVFVIPRKLSVGDAIRQWEVIALASACHIARMGHPKSSATQHRKKMPLSKLGLLDIIFSLV